MKRLVKKPNHLIERICIENKIEMHLAHLLLKALEADVLILSVNKKDWCCISQVFYKRNLNRTYPVTLHEEYDSDPSSDFHNAEDGITKEILLQFFWKIDDLNDVEDSVLSEIKEYASSILQ